MTTPLKNHPGMWLRDDAANAINALEDKYGVIVINSAGRTVAEQQDLIDRFDAGDPDVFIPFRPPEGSPHVKGTGVDVYNYTDDRAKLEEFGFKWFGNRDKVHYDYIGWNGGGNTAPTQGASNPFGIAYCAGLQKIANLYGAGTDIDQIWGPKSAAGFAQFLRSNWGYSDSDDDLGPNMWSAIQRWLKANWGYSGDIDGIPGPLTRAALQTAETANFNELA